MIGLAATVAALGAVVTLAHHGSGAPLGRRATPIADPLRRPAERTRSVIIGAAGNTLTIIHVDSGRANTVSLPSALASGSIFKVIAVGDVAIALQGNPVSSGRVWALNPASLAGRAAPRLLGVGVDALPPLPGSRPSTVSIVTRDTAGHYAVQKFALDGRPLTTAVPVPGAEPLASVSDGYLVSTNPGGPPELHVFEPYSRTLIRQLGAGQSAVVLAAGAARVAWRDTRCGCGIQLFDGSNHEVTSVATPGYVVGYEGDHAAMPPDGTRLAVGLERADGVSFALDVVNVLTGESTITPRLGPIEMTWSPDGNHLFVFDGGVLSVAHADGTASQDLGTLSPSAVLDETPAA